MLTLCQPQHGRSERTAASVHETALGTWHYNGTEVQHTPCDKTVIALIHAWNMQDVLRDGQDGIAFA